MRSQAAGTPKLQRRRGEREERRGEEKRGEERRRGHFRE
jgi:hypothetical protein